MPRDPDHKPDSDKPTEGPAPIEQADDAVPAGAEPKREDWPFPLSRRTTYIVLGAWTALLLVGLAYLKLRPERSADQPRPDQIQARIDHAERRALHSTNNQSRVDIGARRKAAIGKAAPDFHLPGEHGTVSLADYRGKPLLVEFIATWCPHCQAMAGRLDLVMRPQNKVAYLVIGSANEPNKKVFRWHRSFLGRPMVGDVANDRSLSVARSYGLTGYPTLALIDRQGQLKGIEAGELSVAELQKLLDKLASA
jgi:cytochrome c biogenesis protein CcmG/thiol:disulfide interchange protein DsbE